LRCRCVLVADCLGAGGELLRLGLPAGLLVDPGQSFERLRHKAVVRPEHLLAYHQCPMVWSLHVRALDILGCARYSLPKHHYMKPRKEIERTLRQHLPDLRRLYKVRRIGVFGSVVRGEQHGRSDLDILVEYSETPSLLAIVALKRHLSELTGEKVDLVPASALKPAYRRTILNEVVYA
jgi:predicted nucleotidyltransferase